MPWKAYLGRTMLARLLACLALVTGLAAVGAPVHAKLVAEVNEQIQGAKSAQPTSSLECSTAEQRNVKSATQPQTRCPVRKPVVIYIPTVQFGPDRAFE